MISRIPTTRARRPASPNSQLSLQRIQCVSTPPNLLRPPTGVPPSPLPLYRTPSSFRIGSLRSGVLSRDWLAFLEAPSSDWLRCETGCPPLLRCPAGYVAPSRLASSWSDLGPGSAKRGRGESYCCCCCCWRRLTTWREREEGAGVQRGGMLP